MSRADNRFNPSLCDALNAAIDAIQKDASSDLKHALVIIGDGKFFSNGLDLKYLLTQKDPNMFLVKNYEPTIFRVLTLGMPTVAAINGHAFAAGLVLALAADYRLAPSASAETKSIMLSMNELLIRASIPAGMLAVMRAKISDAKILRECIFARKWVLKEAQSAGLVDELVSKDLLETSILFAKKHAVSGALSSVLSSIKEETYRQASALLLDPQSDKLDPFRFAMPSKL